MMKTTLGALGTALLLAGQAMADVTNNITSPANGSVYVSPTEPYAIPVAGIANATGSNNLEIVIALDYSGSIDANEWTLERQGAQRVIDNLRDPLNPSQLLAPVALIGFGSSATSRVSPPSTNYAILTNSLATWPQPGGSTAMGAALTLANTIFAANGRTQDEILFFFSDGVPSDGSAYIAAATTLHNNGVLINSYGIGNGVNHNIMRAIGGETIAVLNNANDHYSFSANFAQVAANVDASMPNTGSVSLDRVEVFLNGGYTGNAALGVGGTYSSSANLVYGLNTIQTVAYDTDGNVSSSSVQVTLNAPTPAIPEPGSLALMGLGMAGLAFAVRRRKV